MLYILSIDKIEQMCHNLSTDAQGGEAAVSITKTIYLSPQINALSREISQLPEQDKELLSLLLDFLLGVPEFE